MSTDMAPGHDGQGDSRLPGSQAPGLDVGFGQATQALSAGFPGSGQSSELCGRPRLGHFTARHLRERAGTALRTEPTA